MHNYTDKNGNAGKAGTFAISEITANKTLTEQETGNTYLVGTDALTVTLPSTKAGLRFTFVNSGAAANNILRISPASTDGIAGTVTLASSVVVLDGTINKDAINTKASSQRGDSITIIGTGTAGTGAWIILSSTGIWAREA